MSAPGHPWSAPPPDADLIRLGAEFDRLYAEWFPLNEAMCRLSRENSEALEAASLGSAALRAVQDETGITAAIRAGGAALTSIDVVIKEIHETPASGFAGLAVKARVCLFDVYALGGRDEPKKDLGRGPQCLQRFAAEIEALAQ